MATTDTGTPKATGHRDRAVQDLDRDLAVTAGAGSGKTTVLVDRFVNVARDPALGPERVLAITFTRKAAVEMKERAIRIFDRHDEIDLRRRTEAAYISTIHAFAERVLRERPFDARIDPAFSVLTEYDQALFFQDALQTMYARADLRSFAQRLGKDWDGGWRVFSLVRDVARLLREGPEAARTEAEAIADDDRCLELALGRAGEHVRRAEARMLGYLRALHPILAGATFRSWKAKYEAWQAYIAAAASCLQSGSVSVAPPEIWRATAFTSEIPPEERAPIRALLDPIKELAPTATFSDWSAQEALERELLPLKRAVYAAAHEIDAAYAAHKRRDGALDFHDLQLRARDLLTTNAPVREEYAERFRHILLDESQDTDELQYDIIKKLRVPGNTLFIVGDPKQAIYEFRGANPDVFDRAVGELPADARLHLPENFRSRPEIIAFVNGIGAALLGDRFETISSRADYGGQWLDVPAITALHAIRHELPNDSGGRPRYEPVSDVRPREAAAVVEEIARLLAGQPLVRDPDSREVEWTPLRPRHIALLFRTRTAIPYFEHALAERGIPYVTAAGQGFYERAEVLDCLMMLRALAQPLDDLAMAAILRSPFCGASDADLWRLSVTSEWIPASAGMTAEVDVIATQAGMTTFSAVIPAKAGIQWRDDTRDTQRRPPLWRALRGYEPLADFRARFVALRRRTRGTPAAHALDDALTTFGYEAAIAAHADGPAMLANVAKLRRQLRDLGAASPLEAYMELERTRELMAEESLAPLVGTADDVVVLTTIHQAKGLEWPVVCLPNLQGKPRSTRSAFSPRHGALLCNALNDDDEAVRPLSIQGITEELDQRSEAEERRLLYVALTRARERLILSACVTFEQLDPKAAEKFSAPLPFLLTNTERTLVEPGEHDCAAYRTFVQHITEPVQSRTRFEGGEPLAASLAPREIDTAPPDTPLPASLPLSLKATELLAYRRCPQVYRFMHDLEIQENLPRRAALRGADESAPSAVELGTRVHALLEHARFDAPSTDVEAARLVRHEPEEQRDSLARMLRFVLEGDIGAAVRAARRVEREWPFALDLDGILMEGVIDLAIQGADGRWSIIDYKSNDLSRTGRLEHLIDHYTPQLELYALALSHAGLGDVADCALVFLAGATIHRWRFDPAERDIHGWARATAARIAAREYDTSAGPKCEPCGYRKRKVCDTGRAWIRAAPDDPMRHLPSPTS